MPKPSHPIRREIRFGMKINKFIDRTKSITSQVNRVRKISLAIYEEEKSITQAEIRQTIFLNVMPTGSKIIGKEIEVVLMDKISHSIKKEVLV